mmetsp:Transcript_16076/g.23775  ORF Transcript_16076/g.23775 Transcript_16076/m.23775 type:complete len:90 (-) Transcript_16076:874-1143(-)
MRANPTPSTGSHLLARRIHFRRAKSTPNKVGAKSIEIDKTNGEFRTRTEAVCGSVDCRSFHRPLCPLTFLSCSFLDRSMLMLRRVRRQL